MIGRLAYAWNVFWLEWHMGLRNMYAEQERECERRWRESIRRQREATDQIGRFQSKLLATDRARDLAAEL